MCVCVFFLFLFFFRYIFLFYFLQSNLTRLGLVWIDHRVMSLVSAKPPHRGRVLTDAVHLGKILPGSSSSDLTVLPVMLPPAHVNANSGTRLREVLAENERLRAHLADAEQSIKNYRSIMNRTPHPERKNVSTQAGGAIESPRPNSDPEGEKKLDHLEKVNTRLSRKNDDLTRSLEELLSRSSALNTENAELKRQLLEENTKVVSLENNITTLSSLKGTAANCSKKMSSRLLLELNSSKAALCDLRQLHVDFIRSNEAHFSDLKSLLTAHVSSLMRASPLEQITHADAAVSPLRQQTPEAVGRASVATSPVTFGEIEMEDDDAIIVSYDKAITANNPLNETPLQLGSQPNGTKDEVKEVLSEQQGMSVQRDESSSKYATIKAALSDLSKLHRAEINAVKHTAHCKDLSRLATIRGITLERDRAMNELRHAK